ncbi:hypothetical protein FACS1894200_05630 [Spirochaetia bacterium]|nr:hypothetical protein FACS1894200_05630 [Spirochaetia bacterium]
MEQYQNILGNYRKTGMDSVMDINYYQPKSELEDFSTEIIGNFTKKPPKSLDETVKRIKELTGLTRSKVAVRTFLKKKGFKYLKTGHIPAKADTATQKTFLEETLNPLVEQASKEKIHLLFLDASHFVHSAFVGGLWCRERIFIPSPSGRSRYNVLGAFNAITHELTTVTNCDYINAILR